MVFRMFTAQRFIERFLSTNVGGGGVDEGDLSGKAVKQQYTAPWEWYKMLWN